MINQFILLFVFLTSMALTTKGQSEKSVEIPDKFQGIRLGTVISDFKSKAELNEHYEYKAPFSSIVTNNLVIYTLPQQLTGAKDNIDIDFFFYHDSLSVIRVRYKGQQSRAELLADLRGKYGREYAFDESVYNDPSTGTSRIIENFYWGAEYFLNFTASDEFGTVCLTFAKRSIQTKLKSLKIKTNEEKIN